MQRAKEPFYAKVKISDSDKELTYIVPKDIELKDGQKIYMFTDKGNMKSAIVVKGNHKDDKYNKDDYKEIMIVDPEYWNL